MAGASEREREREQRLLQGDCVLLSRRNDETDEDDYDDGIDDEDQHLEQVLTHTVARTHTHKHSYTGRVAAVHTVYVCGLSFFRQGVGGFALRR